MSLLLTTIVEVGNFRLGLFPHFICLNTELIYTGHHMNHCLVTLP